MDERLEDLTGAMMGVKSVVRKADWRETSSVH